MELSTNKWLEQVAQHHKEWVKIANLYKVDDYAEDIVQEVNIALFKLALLGFSGDLLTLLLILRDGKYILSAKFANMLL
jgi:hypothetical protein